MKLIVEEERLQLKELEDEITASAGELLPYKDDPLFEN